MTAGRNFYGPGGPYENFAGRDATRGLACQSFDEDMLTKDLDGPLDDCSDLGAEQLENLQGWVERFDEKVCVCEDVHGSGLTSDSILSLENCLPTTRTSLMVSREAHSRMKDIFTHSIRTVKNRSF